MRRTLLSLLLLPLLLPTLAGAQDAPDPKLLAEINAVRAVDNHAHVMAAAGADGRADEEFDAIACGGLEFVSPPPLRLRPDNPIYTGAWRELYGYKHGESMDEAHVRELLEAKRRVMRERGEGYPAWVLDRLNIEVMFANRVAPGRGLAAPRFRWVAYGDPLMLPLDTAALRVNKDRQFFFKQEEALLMRELSALNLDSLPLTLELYLKRVVTPVLERRKREGAVAVKFVAAYMRPLDFADVPRGEAARVYARWARGGAAPWSEYKKLQDFLFRHVAREAGRMGLAVHVHTGGGCGHFFNLSGANPLLLESVLNDPALRGTNFVLVHGGYPFVKEAEFLLEKPNVYADFSAQTFLLTPKALSRVLRGWLEYEPEKILFATDASPATPEVSWEESAWMTNRTAREALAMALTGMLRDGDITRERALELARMVLRENAVRLYGVQAR
ncbi:MAG: amidohydrolase family protein [Pyrinomonadaceae bacterium]